MKRVIAGALLLMVTSTASAQDQDRTPFVSGVVKNVLLDPTTYVPAAVAWESTRLDWQSSQIFFRNGWAEQNARFTVDGLAGSAAVSYGSGNRQIFTDAVSVLQLSLVNNFSMRVVERWLIPRHPSHRKLLRTIGWIERTGVASFLAYQQSAGHLRQWQSNERLAQQLGYR
jgi:hypothetical protein